jgi:hypothetical protein
MKLSELDNIRDLLEEKFDYEIEDVDRYRLVAFLQEIIDLHSYEERREDVECRMPLQRSRKPVERFK